MEERHGIHRSFVIRDIRVLGFAASIVVYGGGNRSSECTHLANTCYRKVMMFSQF